MRRSGASFASSMTPRCNVRVLACVLLTGPLRSLAGVETRAADNSLVPKWEVLLSDRSPPDTLTLAKESAPVGLKLVAHRGEQTASHLLQSTSSEPTSQATGPEAPEELSPLPAAAESAAAIQDGGQLPIKVPPASITVVRKAEALQEATLSGAQDIEIRAHLDLRPLSRAVNPDIRGIETEENRKRLALLYASPPLRSIRGNCSDPEAAAALGLPPGALPDLLPLKPRQCLLVVDDTWLMVNRGSVWVDNLYLKLSRRLVRPGFTFITAGALNGEVQWPSITRSDIYVTATTFHGEHRGNARGFIADYTGIMLYADGCIFTDWAGILSPITLKYQSVATIRNSIFRNMDLHAEIVDVSFEGIVNFRKVLLANVTLQRGSIASTTLNDYQQAIGFDLTYYTEDDDAYDIERTVVKWGDSGVFGEDFKVTNDTFSNCLYLLLPLDVVLPGCSNRTAEARNRTIDRAFTPVATIGRQSTGVPITDEYYIDGAALRDYDLGTGSPSDYAFLSEHTPRSGELYDLSDYEVINSPALRSAVINREEFIWFDQTREALPVLVPPPEPWPSFTRPTRPLTERTSLRPEVVVPPPEVEAAMLGPISVQTPPLVLVTASRRNTNSDAGNGKASIEVMPVLLIITTEMLVVAALLWLWVSKGDTLARWCGCGWITRTGRMTRGATPCGHHGANRQVAGRSRKRSRSGKEKVELRGNNPASAGLATPIRALEAGLSMAAQGPQTERDHGEADWTNASGPDGSLTDISRGADVIPSSSLNPDYEYALAAHLSLAAQCQTCLIELCESSPGGTVVLAPYTDGAQTDHSEVTSGSDRQTAACRPASGTRSPRQHTRPASQFSHRATLRRRSELDGSEDDESSGYARGHPDSLHALEASASSGHVRMHAIAPGAQQQPHRPHQQQAGGLPAPAVSSSSTGGLTSREARAEDGGRDEAVLAGVSWQAMSVLAPATDVSQHATDSMASTHAATRLQRQLASFTSSDLLLGQFVVLGPRHRRHGGQAVVQFVHSPGGHCEFAVKFFLDRASFVTEAALYAAAFPSVRSTVSPEIAAHGRASTLTSTVAPMADVVSKFLPQVEAVCDGAAGGLVDPRGRPLPPCIVMEKGESLQDLCDRAQPDLFTIFSVLSNVSRRLADMHAAGYVHRDIKPANVMWLPRQNRWTVIDFGCVARVGDAAPLSFTLAYAAPEVAAAWRERRRSAEAWPALDAWSLGVTAFELLTGTPAFDLVGHSRFAVLSMLEGREDLPWEGELSAEVQRKFGVFNRPVLQLLRRDPSHRSTLEAFHASCNHIFAGATTADAAQ